MTDWTTTAIEPWLLRGALEVERTEHGLRPHRFPSRARAQFPDEFLVMAETHPTGVRVVFRSSATAVEMDVLPTKAPYPGAPESGYELLIDGRCVARAQVSGGNVVTVDMSTGATVTRAGAVGTARFTGLPSGDKDIEIWLPHTEGVELIGLRTDAPVEPVPDRGRRVWVHHGSSISHGSNADHPTGTWPTVAAARGGVELINLSLRGNALLDAFTARTIRDTPADLISVKIGINLANADLMRVRGFISAVHGFLDTIRDGHPVTPLLVVSPLLCPFQEHTPGPIVAEVGDTGLGFRALGDPAQVADGRLTLTVIRDELARIVAQRSVQDPDLHYLDGRLLYGEQDAVESPLPDGLHPDAASHVRIGERFAEQVFAAGGVFAGSARRSADDMDMAGRTR